MSTVDGSNTGVFQFLLWKANKAINVRKANKQALARGASRVRTWFITLIRFAYHVMGFGCLTFAGFTISITAGWVIAGLSFFGLSFLTTPTKAQPDTDNQPMR